MEIVKRDYAAWTDLGPGGLPANVGGWLIASALRPFSRRDRTTVRGAVSHGKEWDLGHRRGPRPNIGPHPIPHRQLNGRSPSALVDRMVALVETKASADGPLHMSRSRFERRGDALFVSDTANAAPWISRTKGEILHVHETEGSLHAVMEPNDAQIVISFGWGELHPLAGRPFLGLPETYVFLYAPRDSDDADQIERIIERAISTATT